MRRKLSAFFSDSNLSFNHAVAESFTDKAELSCSLNPSWFQIQCTDSLHFLVALTVLHELMLLQPFALSLCRDIIESSRWTKEQHPSRLFPLAHLSLLKGKTALKGQAICNGGGQLKEDVQRRFVSRTPRIP